MPSRERRLSENAPAWAAALALAAVLLLSPESAEAQRRRPLYFGVGVGPYVVFDQPSCCDDVLFRVQAEFGWHVSGFDDGFFLAAYTGLAFGDFFHFAGGLRLGGDIEVYGNRDIALMLTPSGVVGGGFFDYPWPEPANDLFGFFLLAPAFDFKLLLANRLLQLWVRPLGFDFMFFPDYWRGYDRWATAYSFMAGLNFAF
jgi:hypothetical protein